MSETTSTTLPAASPTSLVVHGFPSATTASQIDPYIDPCPSWCSQFGLGHPLEVDEEDRRHVGEALSVEHRYGRVSLDHGDRGKPLTAWLAYVVAYLVRDSNERDPRIHVGIGDAAGFHLTPPEAVALSDVLRELAKQAEQ